MGAGSEDKPDSHLARRAFVGLAGRGALVVALGGGIRLLQPEERFIRPPGALPEEEFLSICIRCDKCYWACPYADITPVLITESIVSAGTPRLKGRWCPNCRRCIPACPVGALVRWRF
jgi:ferredoxin-type protein NapG